MPDLDELMSALRSDADHVAWPEPDEVRQRGEQRTRHIRVAVAVLAGLVTVTVGGVALATRHPAAPPAPQPPTAIASPPAPTGPAIPAASLLTPGDVGAGYRASPDLAVPWANDPFRDCGVAGLPAHEDILAARSHALATSAPTDLVAESVLLMRPASNMAALNEVRGLLAGACQGHFSSVGQDFAGQGSVALRAVTPSGSTAGLATYSVFIVQFDYLIWVEVQAPAGQPGQDALIRQLGQRAAHRFCTAIPC